MTIYNVHIYREMRLTYEGVAADTQEAAASIARDRLSGDADGIDDCDGETLAALVDVVGDEQFAQSRFIDFEPERQRKAAAKLLDALRWITCCPMIRGPVGTTAYIVSDERMAQARGAISQADNAVIQSSPSADPAVLTALQAVLPYAESEAEALYECWKRDGDAQIKEESDCCERAIETARAAIAAERLRQPAQKLLDALKVSEGFVQWALDHGASQPATSAALAFIRGAIAEAESAGSPSQSGAGHE